MLVHHPTSESTHERDEKEGLGVVPHEAVLVSFTIAVEVFRQFLPDCDQLLICLRRNLQQFLVENEGQMIAQLVRDLVQMSSIVR